MTVSALGAILGLALAIFLIVKKVNPAYSLIPYECLVGLTLAVVSTVMYGVLS